VNEPDRGPAGDEVYDAAAGSADGQQPGERGWEYGPQDDTSPDDGRARFPWPPARGESAIAAFGETWTGASLRPRAFFRAMPEHGTIRSALLYYLPLGVAVSGANLFWTLALGGVDGEQDAVLGEMPLGGGLNPLLEFLLAPVILLLSIFVAAAVTHGLLRLFGGANRSYGFTTRIFAFAYSPQILGVVPVVGTVVGFVWMVIVAVIGLKEGHRTSMGRVLAAVLIPVVIALIFVAIAAFIATTGRILLR
jgi:hypothetical protein